MTSKRKEISADVSDIDNKKVKDDGITTSAAPNPKNEGLNVTSSDYYFDSYAHFGIHEEMLKDEVRTGKYRASIEQNAHLFKGKVVLDVGCGTGILSMFAAKAGAEKVYAVECSNIAIQCKQIIKDNGFSDVIEVLQGKMEEVVLPVQYVDIIISEWMGYFLLYESMLDTVIWARDKYLNPKGGIILPDRAILYITAIEDAEYRKGKIDFWDNVYGFNMKVIKDIAITEPLVDCVDSRAIMTNTKSILSLDLMNCKKSDLAFSTEVTLTATKNEFCHAYVAWFDCYFSPCHKPICLSTAPNSKYTHWKQTVFYLKEPLTVCEGEEIKLKIKCEPNRQNPRDLDIEINHEFIGSHMTSLVASTQEYRLR